MLVQEALTTIQTDALPADVVAEIRGVLARHGIGHCDVERPRRRLESLFLEIVERARAEGLETSGARSGGRVADFLRDASGAGDAGHTEAVIGEGGVGVARARAGGAAVTDDDDRDAASAAVRPDAAPPAAVDTGLIDSLVKRS